MFRKWKHFVPGKGIGGVCERQHSSDSCEDLDDYYTELNDHDAPFPDGIEIYMRDWIHRWRTEQHYDVGRAETPRWVQQKPKTLVTSSFCCLRHKIRREHIPVIVTNCNIATGALGAALCGSSLTLHDEDSCRSGKTQGGKTN